MNNQSTSICFVPAQWRSLLLFGITLTIIPWYLQSDYLLLVFNIMALNCLVVLGLNLLIGCAGQVSLGHAAFYGMGAYFSAILTTTYQWPLLLALLLALFLVALISVVLAVPTLRLEGHYLVMATLGFNIIVSIVINQMEEFTGGPSGFTGIPYLRLGSFVIDSDRSFYFFIWALFVVVLSLTLNLTDSRPGRALQAIHDNELAAQAMGVPVHRYKVLAFMLSALYAALAGFCYAHYVTFISPKTFDIFYSVQIVTMVVVGGMGHLWGGIVGAALLTCLPELLHRFEDYYTLVYGLILTASLVFLPRGVVPSLASVWSSFRRSKPEQIDASGREPPGTSPDDYRPMTKAHAKGATGKSRTLLAVRDVSKQFGGIQALNKVSLEVYRGEIVALIGPNGAGKTTLLNIISGLVPPSEGEFLLDDTPLTGLSPHKIAATGVGRTFQTVQVFASLNVRENVLLGCHVCGRSGFFRALLHTPTERFEAVQLESKALMLLETVGLGKYDTVSVQQLTLFQQKLLELVRTLAFSPSLLLLDEPVGGLNPSESESLMEWISQLRSKGLGIILVEHDMNTVMRYADRVVVLQHGAKIAEGVPKDIQSNPKVIEAYLGTGRKRARKRG